LDFGPLTPYINIKFPFLSAYKPFTVVIQNNFNLSGLAFRVDDPEHPVFIGETKPGSTWVFNTFIQTDIVIVSGDYMYFTQFVVGIAPVDTSNKTLLADQFQWNDLKGNSTNIMFLFFNSTTVIQGTTTTSKPTATTTKPVITTTKPLTTTPKTIQG